MSTIKQHQIFKLKLGNSGKTCIIGKVGDCHPLLNNRYVLILISWTSAFMKVANFILTRMNLGLRGRLHSISLPNNVAM